MCNAAHWIKNLWGEQGPLVHQHLSSKVRDTFVHPDRNNYKTHLSKNIPLIHYKDSLKFESHFIRTTTTTKKNKLLARGRDAFLELKLTFVEIVELWAARSSWPVDCTHHDNLCLLNVDPQSLQRLIIHTSQLGLWIPSLLRLTSVHVCNFSFLICINIICTFSWRLVTVTWIVNSHAPSFLPTHKK